MDDLKIHSFIHCKTCVLGRQTSRTEVGISQTGVVVQCKKHGIVVHMSPEQLTEQLTLGARCGCCPGGMHRS